jgi:serine/threonine protein kinase
VGELLEALPKIAEHEAALLYDLLSKIFVYDPARRPTAREMLSHPWFHLPRVAAMTASNIAGSNFTECRIE